jgi:hypothetical protein
MQSLLSCSARTSDRAEIVAEMEIAGRLDAGEDERLEAGHVFPRGLWRAVSDRDGCRRRSRTGPWSSFAFSTLPSPWTICGSLRGIVWKRLHGDRKGQHSIRINDQWRICFRWKDGASDVEITDYHR